MEGLKILYYWVHMIINYSETYDYVNYLIYHLKPQIQWKHPIIQYILTRTITIRKVM
jgi:hypothetical protein